MPVQVTRNYVIKAGEQTVVLSPEEVQKSLETEIVVTCSGPRCQARNARPEPFSVTWKEEEVAKDLSAMPDSFFQTIKVFPDPAKMEALIFCGKICAVDFLNYVYVPPVPPRKQLEAEKKAQAEQLQDLNPHLVQKTDKCVGYEGGCDGDLVGLEHEPTCPALPEAQADGDPGDEHV